MKFSCRVEHLKKPFSRVGKAVCQKGALPVLSNILFAVHQDGQVNLSSTDLEISIRSSFTAKVEEEGSITVPFRILNDLLGTITSDNITLSSEGQKITISGDKFSSKFSGLSADEFPQLGDLPAASLFKIPGKIFSDNLERVLFAVSSDSARPVLGGVLFYSNSDGDLVLVGADGFRLTEQLLPGYGKDVSDLLAVVPAKALREVSRLSHSDEEANVEIYFLEDSNQIAFKIEDTLITARILGGAFPDYKKIMPSDVSISAELDRIALINAVRSSLVFAQDLANVITLEFKQDCLDVSAETQDVGSGNTSLATSLSGDTIKLSLNGKYLLDCLNILTTDKIYFGMNNALSPVVIKAVGQDSFLSLFSYIIMPVRFQE